MACERNDCCHKTQSCVLCALFSYMCHCQKYKNVKIVAAERQKYAPFVFLSYMSLSKIRNFGSVAVEIKQWAMRVFRFPSRCKDLPSFGILCSVKTVVSYRRFGKTYRSIFKCQAVQEECLILEDETDWLSRNVGKKLPLYTA